ncbi:MAG: holo-ACP synthase [Clostridia bacterium]|nr:holo-ACP synthase [Clostridia bacterium]
MNITCGTDIIEVNRIKKAIETKKGKFLNEIYTKNEIEYCESKNVNKFEHYAARFAAKEAIFKAISPLLNNKYDITWLDIEILNDKQGRPYANLNKEKIDKKIQIDISISHIKEYAIANCVTQICE